MRRVLLLAAVFGLALVMRVQPAQAQTWSETAFAGDVAGTVAAKPATGGKTLALRRALLWEYKRPNVQLFEPWTAQLLDNGNVLIADRYSVGVIEITKSRRRVWSYEKSDNPVLARVFSAQRLDNGNTLIVDRDADFVIEVTRGGDIVWQYGVQRQGEGITAEEATLSAGWLWDPYHATRLPNGNTLIVDNREPATRVIEVKSSDYDPDAPSMGYTEDSIVWQYGREHDPGDGPGQLSSPRKAHRLDNGNTLIIDAADQANTGNRVLEVTRQGDTVWKYVATAGPDGLIPKPSDAARLPNGNTAIVEEDGDGRIIEVKPAGGIAQVISFADVLGTEDLVSKSRSLQLTPEGTFLMADQGLQKVIEIGYPTSGTYTSKTLDLGLPGVSKLFDSASVDAVKPVGSQVTVQVSLDGGTWQSPTSSAVKGKKFKLMRYKVTLKTESGIVTPVLKNVVISFTQAPTTPTNPGGQQSSQTTPTVNTNTTASTTTATGTGTGTGSGTAGTSGAAGGAAASGQVPGGQPLELESTSQAPSGLQYTSGVLMQSILPGDGGGGEGSGGGGGQRGLAAVFLAVVYLVGAARGAAGSWPGGLARLFATTMQGR